MQFSYLLYKQRTLLLAANGGHGLPAPGSATVNMAIVHAINYRRLTEANKCQFFYSRPVFSTAANGDTILAMVTTNGPVRDVSIHYIDRDSKIRHVSTLSLCSTESGARL